MQLRDRILTVYRTMSKEQPYNDSATKARRTQRVFYSGVILAADSHRYTQAFSIRFKVDAIAGSCQSGKHQAADRMKSWMLFTMTVKKFHYSTVI
jgi:hypothetical protein